MPKPTGSTARQWKPKKKQGCLQKPTQKKLSYLQKLKPKDLLTGNAEAEKIQPLVKSMPRSYKLSVEAMGGDTLQLRSLNPSLRKSKVIARCTHRRQWRQCQWQHQRFTGFATAGEAGEVKWMGGGERRSHEPVVDNGVSSLLKQ